ncbi:MAG: MOSC domain-containing protein [Rhodocyclaceae bacterium]|nr:MOSC domain-containing protein [Rhodocyclaceae bacterium]
MSLRIASLFRHPVKGLSAEPRDAVELFAGCGVPEDRRFAIARSGPGGAAGEDPPHWQPKRAFHALHTVPGLAAIESRWDEGRGRLELRREGVLLAAGDPRDPDARRALESCLGEWIGADTVPRLVEARGFAHTDSPDPLVSIVSLASLAELERAVGRAVDVRRFRANVVIGGGLPWQELDWVGREIGCGDVRLRVREAIVRCPAIHADPGGRGADLDLLRPLLRLNGEAVFGVYAEVVAGGRLAVGVSVHAPPGGRPPARDGFRR